MAGKCKKRQCAAGVLKSRGRSRIRKGVACVSAVTRLAFWVPAALSERLRSGDVEITDRMTQDSTGQGMVSIVIPCFNPGAMLREALASMDEVRNESVIEVIIVDDGSSEAETKRILKEAAEGGCCVVAQPNRGPGAARNAGIRLAKGEFILPLDSDNRLRDIYLNRGVSLLKENPTVDVIYSDAEYFGDRSGRWQYRNSTCCYWSGQTSLMRVPCSEKRCGKKLVDTMNTSLCQDGKIGIFGCELLPMAVRFSIFRRSDLTTVCGATR